MWYVLLFVLQNVHFAQLSRAILCEKESECSANGTISSNTSAVIACRGYSSCAYMDMIRSTGGGDIAC